MLDVGATCALVAFKRASRPPWSTRLVQPELRVGFEPMGFVCKVYAPVASSPGCVSRGSPGPVMRHTAYLFLSLSALFWSGNFVVGRALAGSADPLALNFWRLVFALVLLIPLTLTAVKKNRAVIAERWRLVVALGATGIALFHVLVYAALTYTTAVNTLLLVAAAPVLIVGCSWLMFRDRVTPPQALGILISLAGAVVLISKGDVGALAGLGIGVGELLGLGAVFVWAVYSTLLKRRPADLDPLALLTASVVAGVVLMAPLYAFSSSRVTMSLPVAGAIAYIVIFASVLAFMFWSRGVAIVGPNTAGVFLHLMPLWGAVMSIIFLGERILPFHLIGAGLVLAGVLIAAPPRLRSAPTRA
jgi:drug/metabolite transporter (DMT)-like permease